MNLEDALLGAGLVLLGFLIGVAWEGLKGRRQERKERIRLVSTIVLEIDQNASACQAIVEAADEGSLLGITPIPQLMSHGWAISTSRWALLAFDHQTATLLAGLYRLGDEINAMIQARDHFQVSMIALSNYREIMDRFGAALKDRCQQYVAEHRKMAERLGRPVEKG